MLTDVTGAVNIKRTNLRVFTFLMAVSLLVAGHILASPMASADIVPGTHACLATSIHAGKQGVVCVDHFISDGGQMLSRGQALCQDVNTGIAQQCAGIKLSAWVVDLTMNESSQRNETKCGRHTNPWHHPPCPTSSTRLQRFSPGVALTCGHLYRAFARGEFYLPVTAANPWAEVSRDYRYNPSGCQ